MEKNRQFWGQIWANFDGVCCLEDSLVITAGSESKTVSLDLMLKRQEEAKRAAMTAANKNPRRR